MFEIERYTPKREDEWNSFVAASKNGTFLFNRKYMDYHADRFHDHSLLFFLDGRLYAIMPANELDDTFETHGGLTYGGLITDRKVTAAPTVQLFRELNDYLRRQGFLHVRYKCVPWIYHQIPAEEDLYAIAQTCHPRLAERDLGTLIVQPNPIRWERIRRRALKRAVQAGISVANSDDLAGFWQVLQDNLQRQYGSRPVHTLDEMKLLRERFPSNILLYTACLNGEMLAGILLYVSSQVVRAQYSSASPLGKELGALDIIYDRIINHDFLHIPYFEFGTSALSHTNDINQTLVFQKEGFGGRAICWDRYEWDL